MFFDFLKPQPLESEEPEEEVTEQQSRYDKYKPEGYHLDNTDWEAEAEDDERLLRKVSGFKLLTKREWWRLRLEIERLKREVLDLRTRVEISADKKFLDEAVTLRDKYYDLLGQSVKDAASIDSLNDQLALKDERIEELREEKEALKRQIRAMASGKAVQKSDPAPTEDPMKAHQFVSATGRTAKENKEICYWLTKAGMSTEEVAEISGIKSVTQYTKQGERLLKDVKIHITDENGMVHDLPAAELDPITGRHPDYACYSANGYSFPQLVTDTLKADKKP